MTKYGWEIADEVQRFVSGSADTQFVSTSALDVERARSAKLIKALKEISVNGLEDETIGGLISDGCIARHAIAEYESSK